MDMNMNADSWKSAAMPRPNMTKEEYDKWQTKKKALAEMLEMAKAPLLFPLPEDDPYYKKAREIIYRERGLIP
jgi:hypothetical protein